MDAGFYKDEAEFRVLVFTVALEMLADGNSLSSVSASLLPVEEDEERNVERVRLMLPS